MTGQCGRAPWGGIFLSRRRAAFSISLSMLGRGGDPWGGRGPEKGPGVQGQGEDICHTSTKYTAYHSLFSAFAFYSRVLVLLDADIPQGIGHIPFEPVPDLSMARYPGMKLAFKPQVHRGRSVLSATARGRLLRRRAILSVCYRSRRDIRHAGNVPWLIPV